MNAQEILNEISQLQTTEESLYQTLTSNAENVALGKPNTFSEADIKMITDQINALSASRVNLYNFLAQNYQMQTDTNEVAKSSLQQQTQTLQILEKELNKQKKRMSSLQNEKYNHLKMVEINTYYSKQYGEYKQLMQMITFIGVCLLASIALDYTPLSVISKPLTIIICLIGGYFLVRKMFYMFVRRNDNYDEFWWPAAPKSDKDLESANNTKIFEVKGVDIPVCAGSYCCGEGTVWSDASGCTVVPPS